MTSGMVSPRRPTSSTVTSCCCVLSPDSAVYHQTSHLTNKQGSWKFGIKMFLTETAPLAQGSGLSVSHGANGSIETIAASLIFNQKLGYYEFETFAPRLKLAKVLGTNN
ncbi:hypothetical protein Ahia01_000415800 [Argonauta hians]